MAAGKTDVIGGTIARLTQEAGADPIEVDVVSTVGAIAGGTPTIENLSMALAANEYSYTFPVDTILVNIQNRGLANIKMAYSSIIGGAKYWTVFSGLTRTLSPLKTAAALTVYFQADIDAQTLEIEIWA